MSFDSRPETPSDRFRERLMCVLPTEVAAKGWTDAALRSATVEAGLSEGEALLALPNGVVDAMDAFTDRADQAMLAALTEADLPRMKIRGRVACAVRERIAAQAPHKEAASRLSIALALPQKAGLGPKLVWRTADRIWRALGDPSTDFNFYSKRAILTGVLASTYARWFTDDSPDHAATFAFLDERIDNVMQFEKLKAQAKPVMQGMLDWAGLAGRLRYGRAGDPG
jgi:ubiquinone biosynthesis protein COQ9